MLTAQDFLPIELVFHPNWWYKNYGLSFDRPFYMDLQARVENDQFMQRVLYGRFGRIGMGEKDPQPRPVIGSLHIAGGFVIPAMLGCDVLFSPDSSSQVVQANLSEKEIQALEVPDISTTSPMKELVANIAVLEAEYGYATGDFDTDGVLNTALALRGTQQLFLDLHDNPDLAYHLFDVIARTHVKVAQCMRDHTGSCSIATNRMVARVDPHLYLHSNCSVQMISAETYERMLLASDLYLASKLQPYGIHHCGSKMHLLREAYAKVPSVFFDVGWGSDVAACREALPDAFFSLRLSPIRMLRCSPDEIAADTEKLLLAAGPLEKAGVCCINMDYNTPDANIFAMFEVVERYRRRGTS